MLSSDKAAVVDEVATEVDSVEVGAVVVVGRLRLGKLAGPSSRVVLSGFGLRLCCVWLGRWFYCIGMDGWMGSSGLYVLLRRSIELIQKPECSFMKIAC